MFAYFDKIFVRIYYWYISKNEEDIPALYSLLIVSLFQIFNLMALIFLIGGVVYGRNWTFSKLEIVVLCVIVLAVDYIRIYRIIGFKNVINRYSLKESRDVKLHPILYFCISILILVILRLIGLYPEIV